MIDQPSDNATPAQAGQIDAATSPVQENTAPLNANANPVPVAPPLPNPALLPGEAWSRS